MRLRVKGLKCILALLESNKKMISSIFIKKTHAALINHIISIFFFIALTIASLYL